MPVPGLILVMGVAGSGKTVIGRLVASAVDADFIDADDYHSAANVERMRRGIPLDDAARAPWLRAVHGAALEHLAAGRRVVLACSALKDEYRDVLLDGIPDAIVVFLDVDRATLDQRVRSRPGHFMPASLLDSQLADLEPPADAIVVDAAQDPGTTVGGILDALRKR
jgi:carbohydrate kinase (thermoresistant glucokinase family)